MKPRQRGMALLVVLLMIAMMTLLAVSSQQRFWQSLRRSETSQFMLQAKWSLLGAEQWLLRQPPPAMLPDAPQSLRLEEMQIGYQWRDNQACFNINALLMAGTPTPEENIAQPGHKTASPTSRTRATDRIFHHLLLQVGLNQAAARHFHQQVIDRLTPGGVDEVSELREIKGLTVSQWEQLAPQLCAQPVDRLNINLNGLTHRQLPLFTALFEGKLSPDAAAALLASRPPDGWKNHAPLLPSSPSADSSLSATLLSVSKFSSETWELLMWTEDEQRSYSLRSHIRLSEKKPRVTHRLYGLSE